MAFTSQVHFGRADDDIISHRFSETRIPFPLTHVSKIDKPVHLFGSSDIAYIRTLLVPIKRTEQVGHDTSFINP